MMLRTTANTFQESVLFDTFHFSVIDVDTVEKEEDNKWLNIIKIRRFWSVHLGWVWLFCHKYLFWNSILELSIPRKTISHAWPNKLIVPHWEFFQVFLLLILILTVVFSDCLFGLSLSMASFNGRLASEKQ